MWGTSGRNEFISCSDKSGKRPNIRSVPNVFRPKSFGCLCYQPKSSNIVRGKMESGYYHLQFLRLPFASVINLKSQKSKRCRKDRHSNPSIRPHTTTHRLDPKFTWVRWKHTAADEDKIWGSLTVRWSRASLPIGWQMGIWRLCRWIRVKIDQQWRP